MIKTKLNFLSLSNTNVYILFTFIVLNFGLNTNLYAQDNVGIGTTTPDSYAILDLYATDKGLLIPRLTAAQRTGLALTGAQTGLLVYDTDDNQFWYWDGSIWVQAIGPIGPTGPTGDVGADGVTGPTGPQGDPATDDQTLSIIGHDLTISGGNTVILPDSVDDSDADATNELQAISFSNDTLYLSNSNYVTFPYDSSIWTKNGDTIYYNTGNVGIGTASPQGRLHVVSSILISSTGGNPQLVLETGSSANPRIKFNENGITKWWFRYVPGGDFLQFYRSGASVVFTDSGNVGIGTTGPNSKLEINAGDVYINTIGNGVILRSPDGTCYRLTVANGGSLVTTAIVCP